MLTHLIDNAVKFTPDQSPITISAKVDAKMVVVCIEDNGPGVAPDEINKLFEKFYRGKQDRKSVV